jgi:indolepyruvate ferredoxin oxidoreductase alpha subunit
MAERSFAKEVQSLRLGAGEVFRGEGILAVTKALLQSGVAYVGGYQGAPISHLVDVLVDSQDLLDQLGVHLETCTNEASAAALLGASINYPIRGCVTWKSIVGTNVAADGLSNLASPGVIGGALIVVGEDYGEGASIIQERAHAYALKSSIWLLDPRPNLPTIVNIVERAFELSEASNTPVMMELRIRACHVTGEFVAKDNVAPAISRNRLLEDPAPHNYDRISHPPSTYVHEKLKVDVRLPAAQRFIVEHGLNELLPGERSDLGIIVQGGLANVTLRGLDRIGLGDLTGRVDVPTLVLNVTHPLVPDQIAEFCASKRAVLIVEEGAPDYIEQQVAAILRKRDVQTKIFGKDVLPMAGEYTAEVVTDGLLKFFAQTANDIDLSGPRERLEAARAQRAKALQILGGPLPLRPPGFCVGCPERPVFGAIKLVEREVGKIHISSDIGCHSFATLAPFHLGNSILGYGMSLAAAGAVAPVMKRRTISVMGDGGFWHNGLLSGVSSAMFNRGDRVLIVMQNGYTSATGAQYLPSSAANRRDENPTSDIAATLKAMGVDWLRTIRTYSVGDMVKTLREAMTTKFDGLKVIIADGECQLARQRRIRPQVAAALKRGERVVRTRYGVDDEICTGDHSCIRLSGCPSLVIKPSPDPLRSDPVAHVNQGCVGCGLCGEVADAAVLCPSFYRAEIVQNPTAWDRWLWRMRQWVIQRVGPPASLPASSSASDTVMSRQDAGGPTVLPLRPRADARAERGAGARPITILIAALGGDGGGVLTDWIVAAAHAHGIAAQATQIPGVAQRTGATTYYIEILPGAPPGARAVLALNPAIGEVDVALATELMEAARMAANGFVTPDRTTLIGSTHRVFAIAERTAMADGRFDTERLLRAVAEQAKAGIFADLAQAAEETGGALNAVLLGALAGSGVLPVPAERFAEAIREEGKAVESNLAAFHAGSAAARGELQQAGAGSGKRPSRVPSPAELQARVERSFPPKVAEIAAEGVRRLTGYQDAAYAALYLDRLDTVHDADHRAGGAGELTREVARQLAVRMSFEDIVRVAQSKTSADRFERVRREVRAGEREPLRIVEHFKPGWDEIASLMPAALGERVLRWAARSGRLGRQYFSMQIATTSVSGFLRLWLMAKLRPLRPKSLRWREEQAWCEAWLDLVRRAATIDLGLAREIAECARLVKGYSDTYQRGAENYRRIVREVIEPALDGRMAAKEAADAVANARVAALADPEGNSLSRTLASIAEATRELARAAE